MKCDVDKAYKIAKEFKHFLSKHNKNEAAAIINGSRNMTKTMFGNITSHEEGREGPEYDQIIRIVYVAKHDLYLQCTTYYSSWEESDWSCADVVPVEPKEVTTTVYSIIERK